MKTFRQMDEDEKDIQLDEWLDELRSLLTSEKIKAAKGSKYQKKADLMYALGCNKKQWQLIMLRAQEHAIPIVFKSFKGYYLADDAEALAIHLQHPTRVTTGTLDAMRKKIIALGQNLERDEVMGWIEGGGVDPAAFCQTLAIWDGLDTLPEEFTIHLLDSGEDEP